MSSHKNRALSFFESLKEEDRKNISSLLSSQTDVFEWENLTCSKFSPGSIQKNELLYRQIVDPVHWNSAKSECKPDAYMDCCNKGMSINRIQHDSLDELKYKANTRVNSHNLDISKPTKRKLIGFAIFKCEELRNIKLPNSNRGFVVLDTANHDDISHGDGVFIGEKNKLIKEHIRGILWEMGRKHFLSV